jgi:predicted esterase
VVCKAFRNPRHVFPFLLYLILTTGPGAPPSLAAHETGDFVKTAPLGATYTLHVPDSYDRKKAATLLFWLHGAGDNHANAARAYLSYRLKQDWIVVFPDAREGGSWQTDEYERVIDVHDAVLAAYNVRRSFIGGFSRGGFYTLYFGLREKGRFAGHLCVSGGLPESGLVKKEDADDYAVAIIHGDADTVVSYDNGVKAKEVFERAGWKEKLFFRGVPGLGHRFDLEAMKAALDWIDENAQALRTPEDCFDYGMKLLGKKKYGAAFSILASIDREENAKKKWFRKVESALKKIDQKSSAEGKIIMKQIEADRNDKWFALWRRYDEVFYGTAFHEQVAAAFALRVDAHNSAAVELIGQAEAARDDGEIKQAIELCLEIRDSCFAADSDAVGQAKEMLAAFRGSEEIARRFRSRLKGTEDWN